MNVKIDFDGFENRVRAVPGPSANYRHLNATPEGVLYVSGPGRLALYNIEAKAEQPIIEGIQDYDLSADLKHIVFQARDSYGVAPVAPGQKPDAGLLKLDGMTMKIEPRKEWAQEYNDAWRTMRDWFYDPNMHGLDWPAIRDKYGALVPYVANREDLNYLMTEMGSELSAGHVYVERGDDPPRGRNRARPFRLLPHHAHLPRRELAGVFPLAAHGAGRARQGRRLHHRR